MMQKHGEIIREARENVESVAGAHNAGAGSLLLAKAKQVRPQGFSLWTFQANLGARRFYERHGLSEARRTDGAQNEENLPDILYEWRL
jgi:hypothetical protein